MSYTIVGAGLHSQVLFEVKFATAGEALEEVTRARAGGATVSVRDPRGQPIDDDDLRWLAETETGPDPG